MSWRAIDPTTWEVKLRDKVKFHDGSDWNAEVAKAVQPAPYFRWKGALDRLLAAMLLVPGLPIIGALMLLVLLVSIGMSWLAVRMERAGKQREAIEREQEQLAAVAAQQLLVGDFDRVAGPEWNHRVAAKILSDLANARFEYQSVGKLEKRIEAMAATVADFERRVSELCRRLAEDLK